MLTDDTLREGMQTPGFAMTQKEKLNLAKIISSAGVKRALVSYPPAHQSEFDVTREIVDRKYFSDVFGLGRTMKGDIDRINDTGSNISLHLPFKLDNIETIYENIKYACTKGKKVEIGFVDIDMFDIAEITKFCLKMEKFGVDVVQLPDTRGELDPAKIFRIIKSVKNETDIKIEAHCHNDHGLAVANTISAISAGADYADTALFGTGERNGIADSITIADYLTRSNIENDLEINKLHNAYNYMYGLILKKIGSEFLADNLPVYGINSGIQTAGTHVAYGSVFSERNYSVNVYTGKKMIMEILKNNNVQYDEKQIGKIVSLIKDESAQRGEALSVNDIIKIAGEAI
jgi:2-isopropylmalate synthase